MKTLLTIVPGEEQALGLFYIGNKPFIARSLSVWESVPFARMESDARFAEQLVSVLNNRLVTKEHAEHIEGSAARRKDSCVNCFSVKRKADLKQTFITSAGECGCFW